ncbi:MAG: protein kinase, partial [Myxococcota bacterium]|nr:protein kinase [Myxococcota bacterium]
LSKVLKREAPLPPERVVHILKQVVKSIAEAHNIGLIHRDVKPDNIFLSDVYGERDFVKVLDFGIAKVMNDEELASLTQTGFICGTPIYLAPELAMGTSITPATDLYSIGVVAYEMLVGRPPFKAETPIAVVMKHIHDPIPPFVPDLDAPNRLKALVRTMLCKDPDRRPLSAEVVLATLEGVFDPGDDVEVATGVATPSPWDPSQLTTETNPVLGERPTVEMEPGSDAITAEQPNAQTSAFRNTIGRPSSPEARPNQSGLVLAIAATVVALIVAVLAFPAVWDTVGASRSVTKADPEAPGTSQASRETGGAEAQGVGIDSAPAAVVREQVVPVAAEDKPVDAVAARDERVQPEPAAAGTVTVRSTPSGAKIYVGGEAVGATPWDVPMGSAPTLTLTLRLPGYEAHELVANPGDEPVHIDLVRKTPSEEKKATVRKSHQPKSAKPKSAKPKSAKPKSAKPKSAKPKSTQPKSTKPKSTKPTRWRDFEDP